jgi:hypothetical protein
MLVGCRLLREQHTLEQPLENASPASEYVLSPTSSLVSCGREQISSKVSCD